jgi:hypothetical protein
MRPLMLRKCFYVSASLLMLALAYHLGASTATAQGSGSSGFIGGGSDGPHFMSVDGSQYGQPGGPFTLWVSEGEVPLSANPGAYGTAIVDWSGGNAALTNTGRVFERVGNSWVDRGNAPGGATPTMQSSWGALKVKAR